MQDHTLVYQSFWHMVDIAKVNAWILYKREEILRGFSEKSLKCLKMFFLEIANALIYAMMLASRGRPSKRKSTEAVKPPPRSLVIPTAVDDIQHDNTCHLPVPLCNKKIHRLSQSYARMTCQKCKVTLCLLQDHNCFIAFHT